MPEENDTQKPSILTQDTAHMHARPRLVIGLAAIVAVIVVGIIWTRYGDEIKEACFGEEDACEVELLDEAEFAEGMFTDTTVDAANLEEGSKEIARTDDETDATALSSSSADHKQGVLSGTVTIGPVCPVLREGEPCEVSPEVYTSRALSVRTPDMVESTKLSDIPLRSDGTFFIALPAGAYILELVPLGIDHSSDLPMEVEVREGATTTVSVDIDTGIR